MAFARTLEFSMKTLLQSAALSGILAAAMFAGIPSASAQVGVSVNLGDVAIGYQDGYWDGHHHWHHWRNNDDWQAYRTAHPENYHDWRHDDPHHH